MENVKRTGKRGIGPLNIEEDFQKPTVISGSTAAEQLPEAIAEEEPTPESELEFTRTDEIFEEASESESEPEQLEIPGTRADKPQVIRDGKMLAKFVRPHFHKEEAGERYVGFEFSFPLTKDHEENGHLPTEVLAEWHHMQNGSSSTMVRFAVPAPQTVAVGLVPGDPENDLILVSATIDQPTLQYVNESGSGKRKQVIRLSFRAVVDQQEAIARFAVDHHGDDVWISVQRTQGSLL